MNAIELPTIEGTRFYAREFNAERDYSSVRDWWIARGVPVLPEKILPKCGVVACSEPDGEAKAAGWLFLDNSVPVATLEWIVTSPGLSLKEARAAIRCVIEMLELSAAAFGYVIIRGVASKAMARETERMGYKTRKEPLYYFYKEETSCQQQP